VIEQRVGTGWRRLAAVNVTGHGFFRWHGALPRGSVVRLRAGTLVGAPLTIT